MGDRGYIVTDEVRKLRWGQIKEHFEIHVNEFWFYSFGKGEEVADH